MSNLPSRRTSDEECIGYLIYKTEWKMMCPLNSLIHSKIIGGKYWNIEYVTPDEERAYATEMLTEWQFKVIKVCAMDN